MQADSPVPPKPTDRIPSDRFIELYLAGECTLAEQAAMERWIAANPAIGYGLRSMRDKGRAEATGAHDHIDVASAEHQLLQRIFPAGHKVDDSSRVPLPGKRESRARDLGNTFENTFGGAFHRPAIIATCAGLLIGVAGLVTGWQIRGLHSVRNGVVTYATTNGQHANITLSDGSTAVLNVASRLEVPTEYSARNRTLRLVGQALFTVRHRDGAPFTVISGNTTTRVLGTTFAVRHYATDSSTTIAVRDGKVALHSAVRSAVLTALQQVVVGPHGMGPVQIADTSGFSFATGVLTIKDMSLADAAVELSRWYDVDIRLGDPALATQRINGKFVPGSLADLTNTLGFILDLRVVRRGRTLTLFQG